MADPVSKFETEVAAVMELLLKVAVAEITKVFERHALVAQCCTSNGQFCDVPLRNPVCNVAVQAGPTSLLRVGGVNEKEASRMGEGLLKDTLPAIVECTGTYSFFKEEDPGDIGQDPALGAVCLHSELELLTQETGIESPHSTGVNVAPDSLGQPSLPVQEMTEPGKVELLDVPVSTCEHSQALEPSAADIQLSQTSPVLELLKPCSVQLVNLLLSSSTSKTSDVSSMPKDLRAHQNAHTGRRLCCFTEYGDGVWRLQETHSYTCKICGKKFNQKKILKRHHRFHTGERPYSCSRCDKAFALRKTLRRHERIHTGETPHSCPHCNKSFRLRQNLKAHLRFHTGERPFSCKLCSKKFRTCKNLEKHVRSHFIKGELNKQMA